MSINILHLSDIQYGRHHVDQNSKRPSIYREGSYASQLEKMKHDLDILASEVRPNFIVITGDIAEWSQRDEYKLAEDFIVGIANHLKIDRRYVVMVPGNHDVNRKLCQSARLEAEALGRSFTPPYFQKFKCYAEFFKQFYKSVKWPEFVEPYRFVEGRLFVNYYFPDQGVAFVGLNSCVDESEQEPHYGNITIEQLRKATLALDSHDPQKAMLRIALMHHNYLRSSDNDEENLKDADHLKPLIIKSGYHLILHGHQHIPRDELTGRGNIVIPVLATGSAGLDSETIPENSRRYQIISITGNRIKVYRRFFDNAAIHTTGKGCWKADMAPDQKTLYEEFYISHFVDKPYSTRTPATKPQIDRVLIQTEDTAIGSLLEFAIKGSPSVSSVVRLDDIESCIYSVESRCDYSAVYIDIRNNWLRKRDFIVTVRKRYPIVPFVLVGAREDFFKSLSLDDRKRFKQYFFFDVDTPLSQTDDYISETLVQVKWDIITRYGEDTSL